MRIAGKSSRSSSAYSEHAVQRVPGKSTRTAGAYGMGGGEADVEPGAVHQNAARGTAGSAGALPFLPAIQASFGRYDISGVRAHTDSAAQDACGDIGAEAYAHGNSVAFSGAPDLHTAAHEAAHVVQQRYGVRVDGGVGRTGDLYEQHADRVADAVVAGRSAERILDEIVRPHAAAAPAAATPAPAAAAVQKKSNVTEVSALSTVEEKIRYVDSYTMADILDTLSGAKGKPLLDELLANEPKIPPEAADRLGAAMRAAGGHIDHVFWMMFGRMHGGPFANECAVIEARVGKKNMSAEKRLGTISTSVAGNLRSADEPDRIEAFKYLNGLNMKDILDVLVLVKAAGLIDKAFFDDMPKAPIHVERLTLAANTVVGVDNKDATIAALEAALGARWNALGPDGSTLREWVQTSPKLLFKQTVGTDEGLIKDGQFQLKNRVLNELWAMASSLSGTPHEAEYQELLVAAAGLSDATAAISANAKALRSGLTKDGHADPSIMAVTSPYGKMQGGMKDTGYALFGEWWGEYQRTKTPPAVSKYLNVFALHALSVASADQCGAHTGNLANLIQGKRKEDGAKKDPAARFSSGVGMGIKRDMSPIGTDMVNGDMVQYGGLGDTVAKMKVALDGGWVLHTRVVSGGGARGTGLLPVGPDRPHSVNIGDPTEHSLLIVGYRGNAFIVSDSDPNGEGKDELKTGFTTIYYDPGSNRLSTAVDEASFPVVSWDDGKGGRVLGNFHADGHHRYQVWSVTSQ